MLYFRSSSTVTLIPGGQHPFASVLTCSDSRVSPELIFDQGLGDLFVVRNAGNVVDSIVLGSLEYGAIHLKTPLIVVMAHQKCGAVTAACTMKVRGALSDSIERSCRFAEHIVGFEQEEDMVGPLGSILQTIAPSAREAAAATQRDHDQDACVELVAKINAQKMRSFILDNEKIAAAAKAGQLQVVCVRYNLSTGLVERID
jgi:carbonic anhydrase